MSPRRLRLRSAPPLVRLVNAFERPLDNAVATARTCYSGKGIVYAEEVGGDLLETGEERERRRNRATSGQVHLRRRAPHDLQHAHFQFALEHVSRQFLWTFLHAHPFYNSEQVSQRYVKVKPRRYARAGAGRPRGAGALRGRAGAAGGRVPPADCEPLRRSRRELYFGVFPGRARDPEKWAREIRRRRRRSRATSCRSRPRLPATTRSPAITLLRYWRLCEQYDVPERARWSSTRWSRRCSRTTRLPRRARGPDAARGDARGPRASRPPAGVIDPARAAVFRDEFDAALGGRVSRLVGLEADNEAVLAAGGARGAGPAARGALGRRGDPRWRLDPAANAILGETLNLTTLDKLSRALLPRVVHVPQEALPHRRQPGPAPPHDARLAAGAAGAPVGRARLRPSADRARGRARCGATSTRRWRGPGTRSAGCARWASSDEALAYLLPNAVAIRFTESADLSEPPPQARDAPLLQRAGGDLARVARRGAADPRGQPADRPVAAPALPLRLRGGKKPFCPEGNRYCGVPVWKQDPAEYGRVLRASARRGAGLEFAPATR